MLEVINRVLLEEWDPIGVGDDPDAQDEYTHEASHVYALLVSGASADAIANYLWRENQELHSMYIGEVRVKAIALKLHKLFNGSHLLV